MTDEGSPGSRVSLPVLLPALLPDEIHVVRFPLDRPVEGALDLLDEDERARAARFVFDRDRRRFLAAHAWMRVVLGERLGRAPASVRFAVGSHGKPRLADAGLDLRFNLTHAGERALLAVTLGREVGVDLERHRPIEALDLARRFFAAGEQRALDAFDEAGQPAAFFRCWTRKEAFVKAIGDGLTFPLDGFEVSLEDTASDQLLQACPAAPHQRDRWRIVALPAEPGYAAALAAEAGAWRVVEVSVG